MADQNDFDTNFAEAAAALDPSSNGYNTVLSPVEEKIFASWKSMHAPLDSGHDYDLRGAFKAGITPDPVTKHWPDTFKKPNHPTFSVESQYAPYAPHLAGSWGGPARDQYIPPEPVTSPY